MLLLYHLFFSLFTTRRALLSSLPLIQQTTGVAIHTPAHKHIFLYDEITRESCLQLTTELMNHDSASRNHGVIVPVHLHIQSNGGSLTSALYVCDVMESMTCPVFTFVEGRVASAASLISVCGHQRFMSRDSFLLLHQASIELGSTKDDELQDEAYNMKMLTDTMLDKYKAHCSISKSNLVELLSNERYMNAAESLKYGLIDYIL